MNQAGEQERSAALEPRASDSKIRTRSVAPSPEPSLRASVAAWTGLRPAAFPLALPLAVIALFVGFQAMFPLPEAVLAKLSTISDPTGAPRVAAAEINWVTSIFATCLTMCVCLGRSVVILRDSAHRRMLTVLVVLGAASILVVTSVWPDLLAPPMVRAEGAFIAVCCGFRPWSMLGWYFPVHMAACSVFAWAVVAALLPICVRAPSFDDVLSSQRVVRQLLLLLSTWLVIGVVASGLFHRIVETCLSEASVKEWTPLATSLSLRSGLFYSMLVAATFGPAELLLRRAADQAAGAASIAPAERKDWLTKQGFALSVRGELLRAFTILSPLVTSALQGLIKA